MKAALIVVLLVCVTVVAQETGKPVERPAPAPLSAQASQKPAPADVEALASDLAQMQGILRQMELNLGFLPAGLTAEKRQFQLEVDMWRALLDHMDRRLQAMRAASGKQ